ncbi:SapC family protein [Saccharophagus degradans]|uniref:SapC family protein n=1 Tax=Saccharophagus degradans TaxID=86304 RepID=UPI001C081B16|nr:SapC family protein [Saccharophagus degradans]MBU2985083.1 SapC family protein [Saccharophagus degradans]
MASIELLNFSQHANLVVSEAFEYTREANSNMVPVLLSEVGSLATHFPLFLTKSAQTGEFVCIALMGFSAEENLYLLNGLWNSDALPLAFERLPFHVGPNNEVYIDTHSPLVSQQDGKRIFTPTGEPSSYMKKILQCLSLIHTGRDDTIAFVQTLQDMQLIEPVQLDVTFCDGSQTKMEGLYTVSDQRLNSLSAPLLDTLNKRGYLSAAIVMNHSMGLVQQLIKKKNTQLEAVMCEN